MRWATLPGVAIATVVLAACASNPGTPAGGEVVAMQDGSTGNSGHGRTVSMTTEEEKMNSPVPGGFGGIMSRTMAGGAGYWTPIGTETGASWKPPTYIGGGPTR